MPCGSDVLQRVTVVAFIHSLHEFAREHSSDQNSSALVTVLRVVIEKCVTLV